MNKISSEKSWSEGLKRCFSSKSTSENLFFGDQLHDDRVFCVKQFLAEILGMFGKGDPYYSEGRPLNMGS